MGRLPSQELFTSHIIARHLPWHEAQLWIEDCTARLPTLIAVSDDDSIVPSAAVRATFGTWQARVRGVRVCSLPGVGHGGWLADEASSAQLVAAARRLRREAATYTPPKWLDVVVEPFTQPRRCPKSKDAPPPKDGCAEADARPVRVRGFADLADINFEQWLP